MNGNYELLKLTPLVWWSGGGRVQYVDLSFIIRDQNHKPMNDCVFWVGIKNGTTSEVYWLPDNFPKRIRPGGNGNIIIRKVPLGVWANIQLQCWREVGVNLRSNGEGSCDITQIIPKTPNPAGQRPVITIIADMFYRSDGEVVANNTKGQHSINEKAGINLPFVAEVGHGYTWGGQVLSNIKETRTPLGYFRMEQRK